MRHKNWTVLALCTAVSEEHFKKLHELYLQCQTKKHRATDQPAVIDALWEVPGYFFWINKTSEGFEGCWNNVTIQHRVPWFKILHNQRQNLFPHLIYCNIVAWLLKARSVVVLVPHNNPYLVQNDSTNQLIGALDLHHDGLNVRWGLAQEKKRKRYTVKRKCSVMINNTKIRTKQKRKLAQSPASLCCTFCADSDSQDLLLD